MRNRRWLKWTNISFLPLCFWSFGSGSAQAEEITVASQGVSEVVAENDTGNVSVSTTLTNQIIVRAARDEANDHCMFSVERDGKTLKIISKAKDKFRRERCKADIAVSLPKALSLDVRIGSGDLKVVKARGSSLAYKIGNGNTTIEDSQLTSLNGRSGSGDLNMKGFADRSHLKVGAGNIDMTFVKAPEKGSLDIKVGSGRTTIALPEHAKISSEFRSGMGSLTNEFGANKSAKFKITGASGTGDMMIKKI